MTGAGAAGNTGILDEQQINLDLNTYLLSRAGVNIIYFDSSPSTFKINFLIDTTGGVYNPSRCVFIYTLF